jgi:hypothetical protein
LGESNDKPKVLTIMPQKIEAITFVDDPSRSMEQLQIACREAGLSTAGSADVLRERLQQYLKEFGEGDEIVCLNPEPPNTH